MISQTQEDIMKTYTKLELDMDWSFIRDKQIELLDGSNAEKELS